MLNNPNTCPHGDAFLAAIVDSSDDVIIVKTGPRVLPG